VHLFNLSLPNLGVAGVENEAKPTKVRLLEGSG
jgi:hypothetical protein